ncbi:MAG: isochorismate synthase [Bifidobacteriaceae bacterium]|jgi:menaquinone-specific isochorismate synthase|nr:isochorismate synthase [Bifidobacteriaceae bacterium]
METPNLHFRTAPVKLPRPLATTLAQPGQAADEPMVWLRRGEGTVAWGQAAGLEITGPDRFGQAAAWFSDVIAAAQVEGPGGGSQVPGMCPMALGTFSFADNSAMPSRLVIPAVAVSQRRGIDWITTAAVGEAPNPLAIWQAIAASATDNPAPLPAMQELPGHHSATTWPDVIAEALDAIGHRVVDKVVLARDVLATAAQSVDLRTVALSLAGAYSNCWTFLLDGLVGATPELLVRSARGLVTSRVLAGTIRRTGDDVADLARAASLARSSKDLEEHQFAVESVVQALRPFTEELSVPDAPSVLHLPNVMHLATDVVGDLIGRDLAGGHGSAPASLVLAGALHPTAAVCGTPRQAAFELLEHLEQADRGRYSGPVGWMAADGAGEWGIALRCAQFNQDRRQAQLWAGGGIVAASDPAGELAETEAKLAPMRQALGLTTV